jgi:hypothetical protein
MERIFEYALIRLAPFAHRGESLNIGLVVFKDGKLDVEVQASASLVKAFGADPSAVDWIKSHLQANDTPTATVEERWRALAYSGGFSLSERGWLRAETDEQYSAQVMSILADYVARPRPSTGRPRRSNLLKELRSAFRSYNILGRGHDDIDRHKVVSNVPVGPAGKLHIDFLLKNGCFHATEAVDFRSSEDSGVSELKDVALAAFTLNYARDKLGPKTTKCYFVFSAPAMIEKALNPAVSLAENSADEIYNLESSDDRVRYLDTILDAAGTRSLFNSTPELGLESRRVEKRRGRAITLRGRVKW